MPSHRSRLHAQLVVARVSGVSISSRRGAAGPRQSVDRAMGVAHVWECPEQKTPRHRLHADQRILEATGLATGAPSASSIGVGRINLRGRSGREPAEDFAPCWPRLDPPVLCKPLSASVGTGRAASAAVDRVDRTCAPRILASDGDLLRGDPGVGRCRRRGDAASMRARRRRPMAMFLIRRCMLDPRWICVQCGGSPGAGGRPGQVAPRGVRRGSPFEGARA